MAAADKPEIRVSLKDKILVELVLVVLCERMINDPSITADKVFISSEKMFRKLIKTC